MCVFYTTQRYNVRVDELFSALKLRPHIGGDMRPHIVSGESLEWFARILRVTLEHCMCFCVYVVHVHVESEIEAARSALASRCV